LQHLAQHSGDDLPGQAILVGEPSAPVRFSARGQLVLRKRVHFRLRLAGDEERHGRRETEVRPPFKATNSCPSSSNVTEQDGPRWSWPTFAATHDVADLRVLEYRGVEIHRFLRPIIEPQEGLIFCMDAPCSSSSTSRWCWRFDPVENCAGVLSATTNETYRLAVSGDVVTLFRLSWFSAQRL
jgi:hypothetical protein